MDNVIIIRQKAKGEEAKQRFHKVDRNEMWQ